MFQLWWKEIKSGRLIKRMHLKLLQLVCVRGCCGLQQELCNLCYNFLRFPFAESVWRYQGIDLKIGAISLISLPFSRLSDHISAIWWRFCLGTSLRQLAAPLQDCGCCCIALITWTQTQTRQQHLQSVLKLVSSVHKLWCNPIRTHAG